MAFWLCSEAWTNQDSPPIFPRNYWWHHLLGLLPEINAVRIIMQCPHHPFNQNTYWWLSYITGFLQGSIKNEPLKTYQTWRGVLAMQFIILDLRPFYVPNPATGTCIICEASRCFRCTFRKDRQVMGRVFGQAEVCRVFGTSSEGKMSRLISRELGSLLGGNFRRQEVLGEHFGIFFPRTWLDLPLWSDEKWKKLNLKLEKLWGWNIPAMDYSVTKFAISFAGRIQRSEFWLKVVPDTVPKIGERWMANSQSWTFDVSVFQTSGRLWQKRKFNMIFQVV